MHIINNNKQQLTTLPRVASLLCVGCQLLLAKSAACETYTPLLDAKTEK